MRWAGIACRGSCTPHPRLQYISLARQSSSTCFRRSLKWINCSVTQIVVFQERDVSCHLRVICAVCEEERRRFSSTTYGSRITRSAYYSPPVHDGPNACLRRSTRTLECTHLTEAHNGPFHALPVLDTALADHSHSDTAPGGSGTRSHGDPAARPHAGLGTPNLLCR